MEFLGELGKIFGKDRGAEERKHEEESRSKERDILLGQLNAELRAAYEALGRTAYDMHEGGLQSIPPSCFVTIGALRKKLDALARKVELQGMDRRCAYCGAMQPTDARYCCECGKRMVENGPDLTVKPEVDVEYCPSCGAMRHTQARFCEVCGKAFAPEAQTMDDALTSAPIEIEVREEPDYSEDIV